MADLQPLLPPKILPAIKALGQIQNAAPPPVADLSGMPGTSSSSVLGAIAPPPPPMVTNNPRLSSVSSDPLVTRQSHDEADLYNRTNPIKPTTTLGKIGHVASRIGNVLGDIFAPGTMALLPGTDLNNFALENRDKNDIDQVSELQNQEAQRAQTAANTAYTQQRPAIEQAKVLQHLTTSLAPKGFTVTENPDSPGGFDIAQDPNSPYTQKLNAATELAKDQALREQILAQVGQPGSPLYEQKRRELDQIEQRIGIAQQTLGLRGAELGLKGQTLAFNEDKNYNPEPTAQQRRVGDLAQSAVNQVQTMRQIVQAHPEIFGPASGRTTTAQAWLGSQSPDAQKFLSASRYLADHSAGVFGSRSVEITKSLEQLTDPKSNPDALNAALDTAESTAQHFVSAGTTHGKGQTGAAASASAEQSLPKSITDAITEGHQVTLSDGSVWRKLNGKVDKVK